MKKLRIQTTKNTELIAWCYLIFQQFFLPNTVVFLNGLLPYKMDTAVANFLIFCINFIFTTLLFGKFLWQHAQRFFLNPLPCLLTAVISFFVYLLANSLFSSLIISAFPNFSNVNDQTISTLFDEHFFLMAIGTVILVPVAEELLHRGLVFRVFYRKNPILGYVASALLFCAIHVVGYIGRYDSITLLICFIQYIPAALILCASYAQSDSIFVPILIHMTLNLIGVINTR
jgi:membrane protease YdiL (CAAX protease family)